MRNINYISLDTQEGRLLLAAIAKISGESQTDKTPDQILSQLTKMANKMYEGEPSVPEMIKWDCSMTGDEKMSIVMRDMQRKVNFNFSEFKKQTVR